MIGSMAGVHAYLAMIRTLKDKRIQAGLLAERRTYESGVNDAIAIIEERGKRFRGAIQPDRTANEIRERLLP